MYAQARSTLFPDKYTLILYTLHYPGTRGLSCKKANHLHRCNRQLLPDDGANRLPKPFIRGCLAIDSLQRFLQAHAIADVDFDDLHIHKVPLCQLFGVKFSFLFVIFCLDVLCLFPARNLVWLTVSPEEALASGKGAC